MVNSLRRRAGGIQLVVADCDGVLTDGGVFYGPDGEVLKRFSIRDGMGVERLRSAGIETAIVSGEGSPSLIARARKLGIRELHLEITDKVSCIDRIVAQRGWNGWSAVAYIGDDWNDLEALNRAAISACPADAERVIRDSVDFRCTAAGGHGAFREFAEWILDGRETSRPTLLPERSSHEPLE